VRPIRGPRALTDDWPRFWHLTYNIARNEFKLRFFGSVLGYLCAAHSGRCCSSQFLYVFFTQIADVTKGQGPSGEYYGAQLLCSISPVHVLPGSDERPPCAVSSTARTWSARSSSRGW